MNQFIKYTNLDILDQFNCPVYVIEHSKAVMSRADDLSLNFKGKVDLSLVKAGAIFHDVGRSKTSGIKHAIEGAKILRANHFPEEIVNIVERHIGAGLTCEEAVSLGLPPKDYMPITLEEKLVAHADNLVHGTKKVDLDFVIEKWARKMGADHPSISRLKQLNVELCHNSD